MKYSYKKIFTPCLFLFLGISLKTTAQFKCGTTEADQAAKLAHPEIVQQEIDYNNWINQHIIQKKLAKSMEPVYTIPMVFHIIHTNGPENISDAQVIDEVAILNRDYAKLNPDTANIVANSPFDTLAADCKIRFKLATIDPNGNCTNGIDRIYSHRTNNANDDSKLNAWPREKYLNVWVVKTIGDIPGVAGYAYYPSATDHYYWFHDGVLILSTFIGGIGTGSVSTGNSRALTHEIAHYLNIQHVWGNTNSAGVSCGDDGVSDTPETRGHNLVCDPTPICNRSPVYSHVYNFFYVNSATGVTDPTPVLYDTSVVFSGFSATGVSANPVDTSRFGFSNWSTGAVNGDTSYTSLTGTINTSKYYQVTITPDYGKSVTITGLSFTANRSVSGVRTFAVRSSVNNFGSNIPGNITPANSNLSIRGSNEFFFKADTSLSLSTIKMTLGSSYKNMLHPVTFRFYGWNAEDTIGSFGIDNVVFTDTAGVIENYQNYMDYSYCGPMGQSMFTRGQKDRMRAALESPVSGRNHLWSADNLDSTGTNGISNMVCVSHPDFFANRQVICPGATVTFTQNLMNASATSRVWTFDGGTPATSTATSPTVTYNTPGAYAVKLKTTNSVGSDSVTKNFFVYVNQSTATYYGIDGEDFENTATFWDMAINNYDGNDHYWSIYNKKGYSGNHCIEMNAFGNYAHDVDDFITKPFNVLWIVNPQLTFRVSAATRGLNSADMTERLIIYSSTNCGQTWTMRATLANNQFINRGFDYFAYKPNSHSDWDLVTVNLPANIGNSPIYFKFEYISSAVSNNVYIDDILISGTVGIDENSVTNNSVAVFPNPFTNSTTISFIKEQKNTTIQVVDILGKEIKSLTFSGNEFVLEKGEMKEGIYILKITDENNNVLNKKMVIQ